MHRSSRSTALPGMPERLPEHVERLAGVRTDDLTVLVRQEFLGTSTCTHLNDTFRCLEDCGALVGLLRKSA